MHKFETILFEGGEAVVSYLKRIRVLILVFTAFRSLSQEFLPILLNIWAFSVQKICFL